MMVHAAPVRPLARLNLKEIHMGIVTVGPFEVGSLASCRNAQQGWQGEYTIRRGDELIHHETAREYHPDLVGACEHALELGKKYAQRLIDEDHSYGT